MKDKKDLSRREFLKDSAAAGAGLALAGGFAPARVVLGANDRIRVGVLGTGQRAQYLMTLFKQVPSTEIVAVCDVYEPHRDKALGIAGPDAKACLDYRQALDLKDVDAVIIGAPDHWHKTMLVDAVRAGKDVYCEKPIMHSIDEGIEMVRAVEESKRVVQSGMQQRSWEHYQLGKHIVDSGKLGKVTFVHTYWYQNYLTPKGWNELSETDTSKLDWKKFCGDAPEQPFTPEKFVWWRFFWDFGGGILTDLLTHWIDVIQWAMDEEAPRSATAVGARESNEYFETPDTVSASFVYSKGFIVTYNGSMNCSLTGGGIVFRGDKGYLELNRDRLALFPEGAKPAENTSFPEPELLLASDHDGTKDHLANFLDSVRARKEPNAPIEVGQSASRTSHLGNLSLRSGKTVEWDGASGRAI